MIYRIQAMATKDYLVTDIDSSGMSIYFSSEKSEADVWESRKAAASFLARVKERYQGIQITLVGEEE